MLVFKIPPYLYIFYFNIAIYFAAYLYRAVLAVYSNYYTAKLLPLRQALLKKGKLTYFNLPVSKHYRVGGQELIYQLLVLFKGEGCVGNKSLK